MLDSTDIWNQKVTFGSKLEHQCFWFKEEGQISFK